MTGKTLGEQARGAEQRLREVGKEMKGIYSRVRKKKGPVCKRARQSGSEGEEIDAVSPAGLAVGHRDRLSFPIPSSLQASTQPALQPFKHASDSVSQTRGSSHTRSCCHTCTAHTRSTKQGRNLSKHANTQRTALTKHHDQINVFLSC